MKSVRILIMPLDENEMNFRVIVCVFSMYLKPMIRKRGRTNVRMACSNLVGKIGRHSLRIVDSQHTHAAVDMYVLLDGVKKSRLTTKRTDAKADARDLEVVPVRVFFRASISGVLQEGCSTR